MFVSNVGFVDFPVESDIFVILGRGRVLLETERCSCDLVEKLLLFLSDVSLDSTGMLLGLVVEFIFIPFSLL